MATDSELPKSVRLLGVMWPVLATLMVGGATMVQASAKVETVERRVTDLEHNGAPVIRERLARMEANQLAQKEQLDRIESLLEAEARGHR